MAFFTATTRGDVLVGTPEDDLFTLLNGSSITVAADAGNDRVVGSVDVTNGLFQLQGGSDTMSVPSISAAIIRGGAGGDLVEASSIEGSNLTMGDGSDTIAVSAVISGSIIEMGSGADEVKATSFWANSLKMGAGADKLIAAGVYSSQIEMGGGADTVSFASSYNSTFALGAGTDSLEVTGVINSSVVQGGGNADTIIISAVDSSIVRGGAGADQITTEVLFYSSQLLGDAGNDTITVSAALSGAFIAGGDGADSIAVDFNQSGAFINGGAGADRMIAGDAGANFVYSSFADSNIAAIDSITVSGTSTGILKLSAVSNSVSILSARDLGVFSTNADGVVTFTSTVGSTLQARAQLLSDALGSYRSVIFDAEGSRYIFVAGESKSELSDDLLISVDASVNTLSADGTRLQFFG